MLYAFPGRFRWQERKLKKKQNNGRKRGKSHITPLHEEIGIFEGTKILKGVL